MMIAAAADDDDVDFDFEERKKKKMLMICPLWMLANETLLRTQENEAENEEPKKLCW